MFKHGFPPEWSTFKKLIWLVGSGIAGAAAGVWKTVTGTLLHLTDALASPMQKCEVTLEPVQDLHGQDAPYPAGGGKNKFKTDFTETTIRDSVVTPLSDGRVRVTGVPTSSFDLIIGTCDLKAGTYILSGCPSGGGATKYRLQVTDYPISTSLGQDSGSGVSFTLEEDMTVAVRVQVYVNAPSTLLYEPMIRDSTISDATWSPYSNICPITGWTGCEVTRTGANLCGGQTFAEAFSGCVGYSIDTTNKTFTFSRTSSGDRIPFNINFKENTRYSIIFKYSSAGKNTSLVCYYTDGTSESLVFNDSGSEVTTYVFTSLANKTISRFQVNWIVANTVTCYYDESGIFEGVLTASDFEPYSGTTASVTFPDTVYGGSHEFVSGAGLGDRGIKVFDGSTSTGIYDYPAGNGFYFGIPEMKANYSPLGVCNQFKTLKSYGGTGAIFGISGSSYIYIINCKSVLGVSTVNDLLTYLQLHPLQFAFPLYEPTEISLTPQPISTLKGVNNVWSNSNGDTTIIYKAQAE